MANDKDFIVKNAVEVGGSTKTTLGTVTNDNIDLSTGNYFAHSPAGVTTYTISNAATNQSFQLEVTGGTEEVLSNFSTTLYTGDGTGQTITNNIDLSTDGGLVWSKGRDTRNHVLIDTERGVHNCLFTNSLQGTDTDTTTITSFNTDGYTMGSSTFKINTSGTNFVSWTFKKATKFFDIVTYTGDGNDNRAISHNLGADIGTIIIKSTSHDSNWVVWHRNFTQSGNSSQFMYLNSTGAVTSDTNIFAGFSSTTFTVGGNGAGGSDVYTNVNTNGRTYVAYLFAHDSASDGLIQCGSYTGNNSASGPSINLGWEPQWLLLKNKTTGGNSWGIIDNQRGITGNEAYLFAQANWGEDNTVGNFIDTTSTGFDVKSSGSFLNGSGDTIIYIAIRNAADLDLTWPTSIEWAGGVAPAAPATGETDLFNISTDDGGTTYQGFKVADNLS